MILKVLEKGSTKVYAPDDQVADYLFLGFTDTGTTTEVVVTYPSKEIVEMKIENDIVTAFRYKGDPVWRTFAGGGGGDTYKVKVDGTDTADYLENKLQQGTNVTITKSGGKLVVNSTASGGAELGETSATAYRGDRGASAYAHSTLAYGTNPHGTTFANIAEKPTTLGGYGITDAVALTGIQTIAGEKTFTSRLTCQGSIVGQYLKGNMDLTVGTGGNSIAGYKVNIYNVLSSPSMQKFTNATTGQAATDGLDIGILADVTAEIRQRENKPLNIYTNNTLVAAFSEAGVTSNLSGTWSTISDERLKENIADISEPISKVESIAKCVKHYNFINQNKYSKGLRTGYIAQLLEENGLEGHVTQRIPNDEEEGALFGWTYKDEEYEEVENGEIVIKTRRVVDKEGEMILGIENNFTPYLFPAFVALLERVKVLEAKANS